MNNSPARDVKEDAVRKLAVCLGSMAIAAGAASMAWATNGDNLIGIGPVSRAMGGTGIAAPQDSITAIFQNPAAMGACPCGVKSESIFGATLFDPTVKTRITTPGGTLSGESQHDPFIIPSVGVTMPLNDDWRFGIGAYGVSGLGVDYRNSGFDLDGNPANGFEGDLYTRLEKMKFAPMLSYQVSKELAVGAALSSTYNNLDLGQGGTHDYTFGAQVGALYRKDIWSVGANFTAPEKASFDRVYNFDAFLGDRTLDTLDLESPATYGAGVAVQPTDQWLFEVDGRLIDWDSAEGYKDFDWEQQWVTAFGAQYMPNPKLALRAGYNYGKNPVETHNGFNPMGVTQVQGKSVPTFGYEMLRTVGFPAIVEHHMTFGLGYEIMEDVTMSLGYMHAFEETISESSMGNAIKLESDLAEDSYSFSLAWAF